MDGFASKPVFKWRMPKPSIKRLRYDPLVLDFPTDISSYNGYRRHLLPSLPWYYPYASPYSQQPVMPGNPPGNPPTEDLLKLHDSAPATFLPQPTNAIGDFNVNPPLATQNDSNEENLLSHVTLPVEQPTVKDQLPEITETIADQPNPVELPVENPIEKPIEMPVEMPVETPAETPVEKPIQNPFAKPVQNVVKVVGNAVKRVLQPFAKAEEEPPEIITLPLPEPHEGSYNQDVTRLRGKHFYVSPYVEELIQHGQKTARQMDNKPWWHFFDSRDPIKRIMGSPKFQMFVDGASYINTTLSVIKPYIASVDSRNIRGSYALNHEWNTIKTDLDMLSDDVVFKANKWGSFEDLDDDFKRLQELLKRVDTLKNRFHFL